jgi:signal transduction histidine kinase
LRLLLGHGPFIRPVLYQSLLALQTFLGVVAITFLVLGASVSERRRATADLEAAIAEQKRLHETAAEANRAKAEFMAVMSHELRTPLNAISGYADLLTMGLQGPLTEEQRQYVSRIQRNEEHLLTLIDEVLGFARIEAGQLSVVTEVVPVQQVIESIETLIETELRKKNLAFNTVACDGSLLVRADPDKLRQILLNLLMNAIKFTDSGGAISVGALPYHNGGPAEHDDGSMIRIWVRDTGIGIPAGQIERVLEPFFQVDRGTTRRYPGVGLGLSIARDLARAMNGDLHLESVPGQGTTAELTLPSG